MILKFNDICKEIGLELGYSSKEVMPVMSNLDDIFRLLKVKGIDEVIVDWNVMLMVALLMVANCKASEEKEWSWDAFKLLREGKVDKFLGVTLHLE